jgi:hypothetical protein
MSQIFEFEETTISGGESTLWELLEELAKCSDTDRFPEIILVVVSKSESGFSARVCH